MLGNGIGLALFMGSVLLAGSGFAQTLVPPMNPFLDDPVPQEVAASDESPSAEASPSHKAEIPAVNQVRDVDTDAFIGLVGEDVSTGVKVLSVNAGGPAEQAGILPGDVLYGFEGQSIRASEEVATALEDLRPGQIVQLVINREGEAQHVSLRLGARRRPIISAHRPPSTPLEPVAVDDAGSQEAPHTFANLQPHLAEVQEPAMEINATDQPAGDEAIAEPSRDEGHVEAPSLVTMNVPTAAEESEAMDAARPSPEIYRTSGNLPPAASKSDQLRASLGVRAMDINDETALKYAPAVQQGALIVSVDRASAADRANLMRGMVIIALDGHTVSNADELSQQIDSFTPGQEVSITYQLGHTRRTVSVCLDSRAPGDEDGEEASPGQERDSPAEATTRSQSDVKDDLGPRTIEVVALPMAVERDESAVAAQQQLKRQYESMQVELEVLRQTVVKLEAKLRMMDSDP